jgi:hypothetical protein
VSSGYRRAVIEAGDAAVMLDGEFVHGEVNQ